LPVLHNAAARQLPPGRERATVIAPDDGEQVLFSVTEFMECPRWLTYCGLMYANLITLAHFLVSPAISLPKSVTVPAISIPP
jgi:hypothetical protein